MAGSVAWRVAVVAMAAVAMVLAKPLDNQAHLLLRMPDVQPQAPDTYLCYPVKMDKDAIYITGFKPHANMSFAHHMLIYGCAEPGDNKHVWNCGEMAAKKSEYKTGPVCASGAKIIYAWAMDAPDLQLPKDVAFKVGGDSGINWLVLQVHYKDVTPFTPPINGKDHSNIDLTISTTPYPKEAGVYLLGTGGQLAPHATVYMETACLYNEEMDIHPFAYRAHAHTHGLVNAGYLVRDGVWKEIGRVSPRLPEMFYPATTPNMDVHKGDILAARCTMKNDGNETINIGSTQHDEMCNFYVMYWVEGDRTMEQSYCFTPGPPTWDWSMLEGIHAENAPANASMVPGSKQVHEETTIEQKETAGDDAEDEVEEELEEINTPEGQEEVATEEEVESTDKLSNEEFMELLEQLKEKYAQEMEAEEEMPYLRGYDEEESFVPEEEEFERLQRSGNPYREQEEYEQRLYDEYGPMLRNLRNGYEDWAGLEEYYENLPQ